MPAGLAFEEADDAISWERMQNVLSPQLTAHGCGGIVFDVVQRLKSRRYPTVLNTFTLLHTYSLNAGDKLREVLVSDHLFNTFSDIQSGRSNTLAAGLAQLLYDWRDTSLGLKYKAVYDAVLPRAAPHIRTSAPAEKFLVDPPDPAGTFRRPLQRGFDFSLFNQKHRSGVAVPAAYVRAAAPPPAVDLTADNPTTGDSQPHTDGGARPRSARELNDPALRKDKLNTTAPAAVQESSLQASADPAPREQGEDRAPLHQPHLDDAHHALPHVQQNHTSGTAAVVAESAADDTRAPAAHALQAPPLPHLAADSVGPLPVRHSHVSKARLGPSHACGADGAPSLPSETWDNTTLSYPDSCFPDQPMPDYKSEAFIETQTSIITPADEQSVKVPTTQNGVQNSDSATAAEPDLDVPHAGSIAELHQRIIAGFQVPLPGNDRVLVIPSETSVSTPLGPLQQGRNKDVGSDVADSYCIQSDVLQLRPPATAEQPGVAGLSRNGGAPAAPQSLQSPSGTAMISQGISRLFDGDPGAQTIAWQQNAPRHTIPKGPLEWGEDKAVSSTYAVQDAKAVPEVTAEHRAQQQQATAPAPPTDQAGPATPVDDRYLECTPAVPAVATGSTPTHSSKPSSGAGSAHGAGASPAVVRPPPQITAASPRPSRNCVNGFDHAELSPTPHEPLGTPSVQHVNGLIEGLAAQVQAITQFTYIVENCRHAEADDKVQGYIDLGNTQAEVFEALQQQVQKALAGMREELEGASDIALQVSEKWIKVSTNGKASLARWQDVVGPSGSAAASPFIPTENGARAVSQHSSDKCVQVTGDLNDSSHAAQNTQAENVASHDESSMLVSHKPSTCPPRALPNPTHRFAFRQPSLRMHRDCGYVAELAMAVQRSVPCHIAMEE